MTIPDGGMEDSVSMEDIKALILETSSPDEQALYRRHPEALEAEAMAASSAMGTPMEQRVPLRFDSPEEVREWMSSGPGHKEQ